VTRANRAGYKAGALAEGLRRASGEFVAMFDADFAPPQEFLRETIPHFADLNVGCVQARWGHLNRYYTPFTAAQSLGVDGHFVIEQTARSRTGLFINFNGSAGVWRRTCIDDSGGWRGDTLTEDLDLSYRAQLRGWRIVYAPDVVVPAEIPAQVSGFKRQQARWAQGSIQTAMNLLAPLLRSRQPWFVKLEGCIHLTSYLVHPLMLLVVLLTLPMGLSQSWLLGLAPWLMVAAVGPPLMYVVAATTDGPDWGRRLRYLPLLVLLGMGLALSNTRAVLKAVLGLRQGFDRTPKFALQQNSGSWVNSSYAQGTDWLVVGELLLAAFALLLLAAPRVTFGFAPWLLLYAGGFTYVAVLGLAQARQLRRWTAMRPTQAVGRGAHTGPGAPRGTRAGSRDPGT
jgi:cellulose synthase/poly-beta-1,6-N-acetylglucosamine synthase-like glycosyltransferase